MSSMLSKIYTHIYRMSPTLAAFAEQIYDNFPWRKLKIIKHSINNSQINHNYISILRSLNRIEKETCSSKIAFISQLPPSDTGIAACSYYTFKGGKEHIDLYFSPASDEEFLLMTKSIGNYIRVLDSSLLLYANELINYKKIIIALGNSHHHYYLCKLIKKIRYNNIQDKIVLYIHDPYMNDFIQYGLFHSPREYIEQLSLIYELNVKTIAELYKLMNSQRTLRNKLIELNIMGLRFFTKLGFSQFLVNSNIAKSIIESDCDDKKISVKKIFHPVFNYSDIYNTSFNQRLKNDEYYPTGKCILLGTFGIPSHEKFTETIIEAVSELRKKNIPVRLIVSGFGAKKFFSNHTKLLKDYVMISDSPSDENLNRIMQDIDIAIQLRRNCLGETSGVVSQLLAARKKIICSPIGSFLEFGDSVFYFNGNNSKDLAIMIIKVIKSPVNLRSIERYCANKTPIDFRKTLINYYG